MKITQLKTYLTEPSKCFVQRCKARCCTNVPLPEDFLPSHTEKIQRKIYSGINIGHNDPRDTYNSVIYNTTQNPIQLIGVDQNGNAVVGIPPKVIEELQIKSMEQIQALMANYNQYENYCPYITTKARCSIYEQRPPICREFGTDPAPINHCHEKSSRLDIAKFYIKDFFELQKDTFKLMWQLIRGKDIFKLD